MSAPYQRLLVPIDGSATAQCGLQEAIGLAKVCDASLVLLSVLDLYPVMIDMASGVAWDQVTADLRSHLRQTLDQAHARVQAAGLASEALLVEATAARVCDAIVETAKTHRCDLIVMGTHGRRGVAHAVIGSDAERVLRMAPCPVLLVRAQEDQPAAGVGAVRSSSMDCVPGSTPSR